VYDYRVAVGQVRACLFGARRVRKGYRREHTGTCLYLSVANFNSMVIIMPPKPARF